MKARVLRIPTFLGLSLLLIVPSDPASAQCGNSTGKIPLIDLGAGTYQGFQGGLYPGGANTPPPGLLSSALSRAASIQPLDGAGNPDPVCGKIVLVSIGMSNAAQKFGRFERQEDANSQRNTRLVLVNGAEGGKAAEKIAAPGSTYWQLVLDRLGALGLTHHQVQAVWLEEATANPRDDFPSHALHLRDDLEAIVRKLHDTFPNLTLCYISDRSYGGYTSVLSPEPQAYETGFAVRWLIEDQIAGKPSLNPHAAAGQVEAPLLLWGPYLWADGGLPNSRGTQWCPCDFESCANSHPSASGEQKVADLLSSFFATDPTTQTWFLKSGLPGQTTLDAEADAHVLSTQPGTNFGADVTLRTEDDPKQKAVAYLRFDLSGIQRPAQHVKLSFRNPELHLSRAEREVFVVDDVTWDESTITYASAPSLGSSLGVIPRSSRDGTRSLDVTDAINTAPGTRISFALAAALVDGSASLVDSRESGRAPRLVLMPRLGGPEPYCTSGVSSSGCRALIGADGLPSATASSGFVLRAAGAEGNKAGLFFFGTSGRQAYPWGNSTSRQCVTPPVKRTVMLPGAGANGTCDGVFAFDLNAHWCLTCAKGLQNPGPGAVVQSQLWYRDPASTSNRSTSLSDAIEFTVCN